ncbi:hypothetical protein EK904_002882 [Melospiza melodia maxima]|nr:hypothetical protein EK904_002882 [Melospiza melodia maxima]
MHTGISEVSPPSHQFLIVASIGSIVEAGSIPDLWRSSAGGEQVGENIPSVVLLLVAQFEQGPVVVQLVGNFCADTRMMLQLELIPE